MVSRMLRSPKVQLVTWLAIRSPLGTTISARSKVWIVVARNPKFITRPCWPSLSWITSPTLMGRSNSRISPETKLLTMACMPKPMPTPRAPPMMVTFFKLKAQGGQGDEKTHQHQAIVDQTNDGKPGAGIHLPTAQHIFHEQGLKAPGKYEGTV